MMRKILTALLLLVVLPTQAAITLVGSGSVPATDNTPNPDTTPSSFTTTVAIGDLIDVNLTSRDTTGITLQNTTSAGQTWTARTQNNANGVQSRSFCAIAVTAGSISPAFGNSSPSGSALNVEYTVWRASSGFALSCTPDVAEANTSFAAPGSPFDVTATGQTSTGSSVTRVYFMVNTNSRTWALQTGGWTNINGTQIRNTTGSGLSTSGAYLIQASAGATGNVTNRQNSTGNAGVYRIITYKETAIPAPTFSVAPSVSVQSIGGYTLAATPSAAATWYSVATIKGSATPTCTQVKAGQNGSGGAALAANSKAVTGADTLVLTGLTFPTQNISSCLNNGGGDSAVSSLSDQFKLPPTGKQYSRPTSYSGTSPFSLITSPAIATPDVVQIDLATTPSVFAATVLATGDINYTGDASRQTLLYDVYDDSVGAFMAGGPATLWFNNGIPSFTPPSASQIWKIGVPIVPIDFCGLASDPENDALTASVSPAWSNGTLALGGVNNCTLSGTPSVEDEDGATYTVTVTDIAGATGDLLLTAYLFDTVTIPNCVSLDQGTCLAQLVATNAGLTGTVTAYVYSPTVPANAVISQSPVGGAEAEPQSNVGLVVSLGTSVIAPTVDGYSFIIDPDLPATLYGVAMRQNSPAPTCSQIVAHTGALGFGTATSFAGEQVNLTIGGLQYPRYDVYLVGRNNANVCSAISSYPALLKLAPGNSQYVTVDLP